MDKLAKRAGVAALILFATAGSALAWGLGRFASNLDRRDRPLLRMDAALKQPKAQVFAAMAASPPPALETAPAPLALGAAVVAKPDLASAFGKALGAAVPRSAPRGKSRAMSADRAPDRAEADDAAPRPDDLLDFGPDASEREAKLSERDARAFRVRQPGGAEQAHKLVDSRGERVTFETDLAKPGDH